MAIKDHSPPGMGEIKQSVRIITVDPATRRVEAALKDGAMIQVRVYDIPTAFRWPGVGEIWLVRRDSGMWELVGRVENPQDGLGIVEEMTPGDTKITGNTTVHGSLSVTGWATLTPVAVADVPNNSFFIDETTHKARFKDSTGTSHDLY